MNSTISARGERAAVAGYRTQYNAFAKLTYELLALRELVEIHVADPNVGKLDDIFIVTKCEVHAYQVKHSINESTTLSDNSAIELLAEVVKGWRSIKLKFPGKKVIPHLLTTKKLNRSSIFKDERHADLSIKIGLKEDENNFWDVLDFSYDADIETNTIEESIGSREVTDIVNIRNLIVDQAADKSRNVVLTAEQIIQKLHWEDRFNTFFDHFLHIDESFYVPISRTLHDLNSIIDNTKSGYVFLEGEPGSGKSTLLSDWRTKTIHDVIPFYAFDYTRPSKNSIDRGSVETFLHDMVFQLVEYTNESHYRVVGDVRELNDHFQRLLVSASQLSLQKGKKLILIIDGLDHVPREYCRGNQLSNMLFYLPLPEAVPDNVIILLGSQFYNDLEGLSEELKLIYQNGDRVLSMTRMSFEETTSLVQLCNLSMTPEQLRALHSRTAGHPLYTRYILQSLLGCEKVETILDNVPSYQGDIQTYYHKIAKDCLKNPECRSLLALLSRIEGDISVNEVLNWDECNSLALFREKANHLLRFDREKRHFGFFHNSFRQFLQEETGKHPLTGITAPEIDRQHYQKLVGYTERTHPDALWKANKYRYFAHDYNSFIEHTNPDILTQSLCNFRPVYDVKRDIAYALSIARETGDIYLFLRYTLFAYQLEQMGIYDIGAVQMARELFAVGRRENAMSLLLRGNELECSEIGCLSISAWCGTCGYADGRTLFVAGKDAVLRRKPHIRRGFGDPTEEEAMIKELVRASVWYEEFDNICMSLPYYAKKISEFQVGEKQELGDILCDLELEFHRSLLDAGKLDWAEEFLKNLKTKYDECDLIVFYAESVKRGDYTYLNSIIQHVSRNHSIGSDLFVAHYLYETTRDVAQIKPWLESYRQLCAQQEVKYYQGGMDLDMNQFRPLYRYARLRRICGYQDTLDDLVPMSKFGKQGNTYQADYRFAKAIVRMAQLDADVVINSNHLPYNWEDQLDMILTIYRHGRNFIDDTGYYRVSRADAEFCRWLGDIMKRLIQPELEMVASKLLATFDDTTYVWTNSAKRTALVMLNELGYSHDICTEKLHDIEQQSSQCGDVAEHNTEYYQQGRAWLQMNEQDHAIRCLRKSISCQIGPGYRKDPMPTYMAGWLRKENRLAPDKAEERISWFASRMPYLTQVSEYSTYGHALEELILSAYEHRPVTGWRLQQWVWKKGLLSFERGVYLFVRGLLPALKSEDEFAMADSVWRNFYLLSLRGSEDSYTPVEEINHCTKRVLQPLEYDTWKKASVDYIQKNVHPGCREKLYEILNANLESSSERPRRSGTGKEDDPFTHLDRAYELFEQGRLDDSKASVRKALSYSRPYGWTIWNDGGSRLRPLQLYYKIDPKEASSVALKLLCEDAAEGDASSIVWQVDDVLYLFGKNLDHARLYEEKSRLTYVLLGDDVAEQPDLGGEDRSIPDIIMDFSIYSAQLGVFQYYYHSLLVLADLFDHGANATVLIDCSRDDESLCTDVMMLVKSRGRDMHPWIEVARKLACSNRYAVRLAAREVLDGLNQQIPSVEPKNIPMVYKLDLPLKPSIHLGDRFVDLESDMDVTRGAAHLCGVLSRIYEIPEENVALRIRQLMEATSGSVEKIQAKDEVSKKVIGTDLEIHYFCYNSLSMAAMDAAQQAAAELVDSMNTEPLWMRTVFRRINYRLAEYPESNRPNFIQDVRDHSHGYERMEEWRYKVSARLYEPIINYELGYIIAEHTLHEVGDNSMMEQDYLSELVAVVNHEECPITDKDISWADLLDDKFKVLYVNPSFAKSMGWQRVGDDPYAWTDADGVLMVKSVFWRDGNTKVPKSYFRDEVACGWYVWMSRDALCQVQKRYPNLRLRKCIGRGEYGSPQDRVEHTQNLPVKIK